MIFNKDCIAGMQDLIKQGIKVDCIITDPPYIINYKSARLPKNHKFSAPILNDDNDVSLLSIKYMADLLKDGGGCYIFCSEDKIDLFKQTIEKYLKIKNILVWVKNTGTLGDGQGGYQRRTEFIVFAVKGRHLLNGKWDTNVLLFNKVPHHKQLHQNQKPLKLISYLLMKSTQKGDTVLDAFMGSGTTGVGCKKLHRNFIGFELDKTYYNIAKKRIDEA